MVIRHTYKSQGTSLKGSQLTFRHTEHEFITEIYIFKPEETIECVSNVSTLGKNIFDDTDNNPIVQSNSFKLPQVETSPVFSNCWTCGREMDNLF